MKILMFATAAATALALAGCGTLERVNPAARSASTTYNIGDIKADNGSTVNLTIGDGAMAAADGDGAVTQPTTTTTSVPTTFSTPAAMDPVSMGIKVGGDLVNKALDVYATKQAVKSTAEVAAAANANCPGGNCSESVGCPDGNCGESADCPDGVCSE